MSAEATEIQILATATHPVHGRVIVFERSDKFVFVAPVTKEYPWYGQDFRVSKKEYEQEFREEGHAMLEAQCNGCGAMCELDAPDHEISRADAEWSAMGKLYLCCGTSGMDKIKFEWRKPA